MTRRARGQDRCGCWRPRWRPRELKASGARRRPGGRWARSARAAWWGSRGRSSSGPSRRRTARPARTRLADVLVPRVGVLAEVLVVVLALEVLVGPDHLVGLAADVGPEDLRRDHRVVHHRNGLADVVAQRRHDDLVAGAGLLGAGGGLERVDELVDLEAVGDLLEGGQHLEDAVGHAGLVLDRLDDDVVPLLFGRLVHAGERHVVIIPRGVRRPTGRGRPRRTRHGPGPPDPPGPNRGGRKRRPA